MTHLARLLLVALILVAASVRIVQEYERGVIFRLGRLVGAKGPGLFLIIPFIDRVAYKHVLKEFPLDVPSQVCITRDNTQLQVDGILYFQVTDPMRASYGSSNYVVAITQLREELLAFPRNTHAYASLAMLYRASGRDDAVEDVLPAL